MGATLNGTEVIEPNVSGQVQGDVLYNTGTGWAVLAAGDSGQVLETLGAGSNPVWADSGSLTSKAVISFSGNATSLALTDQNTWYQVVTFDTNNVSRGDMTADQANDRITVASGYNSITEIEWNIAFTINANSQVIEVGVSDDGGSTIKAPVIQRKAGTGADVGSASMQTAVTIDASGGAKQVTLWARNTTSAADDLTITECYLEAKQA